MDDGCPVIRFDTHPDRSFLDLDGPEAIIAQKDGNRSILDASYNIGTIVVFERIPVDVVVAPLML